MSFLINNVVQYEYDTMIAWLESKKSEIPNSEKLIIHLKKNPELGHLIHAKFVKLIYDVKTYKITAIEKTYKINNKTVDIDIELNDSINIQVWYAQGLLNNFLIKQNDESTKNDYRKKLGLSKDEELISSLGGTRVSWENQEKEIMKKINQLPNDKLSIVFLLSQTLDYVPLPDFFENVHKNKCLVCFSCGKHIKNPPMFITQKCNFEKIEGVATIFCSDNFDHSDKVEDVIRTLGFSYGGKNMIPSTSVYFGNVS